MFSSPDDEQDLRSDLRILREVAEGAGREGADLRVVVFSLAPITRQPIDRGRPFLGGSPEQIAKDLLVVRKLGVDDVAFRNDAPGTLDEEIELMERLYAAAGS